MPMYHSEPNRAEPNRYTWFSVQTPSVFKELKLPANASEWTQAEEGNYTLLEELAREHGTYVRRSEYRSASMAEVTLEFVGQRLKDMQALLLALNDNATAVNRRLDRIDERLGDQTGEIRRIDNSVQALTLRIAELAVRLGAMEQS